MAIPSSNVPLEDRTTPVAPPNIGFPLWAFIIGVDMKTSASPIIGQIAAHRGDDNLFISPPLVDLFLTGFVLLSNPNAACLPGILMKSISFWPMTEAGL